MLFSGGKILLQRFACLDEVDMGFQSLHACMQGVYVLAFRGQTTSTACILCVQVSLVLRCHLYTGVTRAQLSLDTGVTHTQMYSGVTHIPIPVSPAFRCHSHSGVTHMQVSLAFRRHSYTAVTHVQVSLASLVALQQTTRVCTCNKPLISLGCGLSR